MSTHIFTPITDRFGYGKYLDLEIIIDSETGYINASKLCQLGDKKLKNWLRLDSAKTLMDYYNNTATGSDLSQWYYEIGRGDIDSKDDTKRNVIMGTYFHRKLIVHIAQWISCEFAMKVSDIIDDYNDRHNRSLLKEKDDKIDELMKKVDAQSIEINKMLSNSNDMKESMHDMKDMMTDMRADIRRMRRHLDNAEIKEDKREGILVYRLEQDDMDTIRIRCGTSAHLSKFINKAKWYRSYDSISNAKRALNYMKENDYLSKQVDTKYYIPDKDQRVRLLKILRKVDASYKN